MHYELFKELVPENSRSALGPADKICIINGSSVYNLARELPFIIMACNPRIKHVLPGIMRAAQELDALVAFELTATEGGLDGGYTGQTPARFVEAIIDYADAVKFSKPFIIHGDHITVKNGSPEEREAASKLIAAQIDAGYSSFAIDASFNPLRENIEIVSQLAPAITRLGLGLEVELGEVAPVGRESSLTTVGDVEEFLSGLAECDVAAQLLAIDNGSKSGNYLDGEHISIDLQRTGEIHAAAARFGVTGLVQHGITGTPLRIVGKLADYGIRKGNIGTLWQNVAHAGLPPDLIDAMRDWSRENRRDIKYATAHFYEQINDISAEDKKLIADLAYREAKEFISAFNAKGSVTKIADMLKTR